MNKPLSTTLFESIYTRLRTDIIDGTLSPDSKLRIEELREKYEISASPLREALNRLAGEGFVNVIGQRGFRVAPVSIEDLRDLSRMRILLECEALTESIANGDDEGESNIIHCHYRLGKTDSLNEADFEEREKRNKEFHNALIAACTSPLLLRYRDTLYEQHKRYRFLFIMSHDESRDLQKEHEEIKEAALARDVKRACEATRKHIQNTEELDAILLSKMSEAEQLAVKVAN